MLPSRVGEAGRLAKGSRKVLPPEQRHPRAEFGWGLHLLCGGARFADTLSELDSRYAKAFPIHLSSWKENSPKLAPGDFRWHHTRGAKGWPAE